MEPNRLIKRRLVYHFFISDNYATNDVYKIHFACLEYFADIFDEAVFIITSNNENAPYMEVENKLLNIFKNTRVTIEVKTNTELCEAETFYNEVVKKNENVLTFFFHTKGITNIRDCDKDNIIQWILMIYYYSLNFQTDMEEQLLFCPYITFYGSCKGIINITNKTLSSGSTIYMGCGYWINNGRLLDKENDIPQIKDRWYGEMLPYSFKEKYKGSYKDVYIKNHNYYYDDNEKIVDILEWYDKEGVKQFYKFKEKILALSEKYM